MTRRREQTGICKLCGQSKRLHQSHILSKFLRKHIIWRPEEFTKNGPPLNHVEIVTKHESAKISRPQGFPTEYLLCFSCEQILGNYEDVAKKILIDEWNINQTSGCDGYEIQYTSPFKAYCFSDTNTMRLFRLFILSLLWRLCSGITQSYPTNHLGDKHCELIRAALLESTIKESMYQMVFVCNLISSDNFQRMIHSPFKSRISKERCYIMGIGSWSFIILVHNENHSIDLGKDFMPLLVDSRPDILIPVLKFTEYRYLVDRILRIMPSLSHLNN